MSSKFDKHWQGLFEEAMTDVVEWRQQHPQATFNKIEEKMDTRLAQVRAQLLQDLVQMSASTDLRGRSPTKRPLCPECSQPLAANGQHTRDLITTYEQMVTLRRSYGRCPECGHGFFPLDEELGLLPGGYTPQIQEAMTRLGAKMAYEQAQEELQQFCHTLISESTMRRHTMQNGQASEALEKEETVRLEKEAPEATANPDKVFLSADGAFVALTTGEWREVKTVTIGEFETVAGADGKEKVQSHSLSYFSRSYPARDFEQYALPEIHRRGLENANVVVSPNDGAIWIQGFVDYHCPEAIRILDFPHAQGYLADAGKAVYGEGSGAFKAWYRQRSHELKHDPPQQTLTQLDRLHQETDEPDVIEVIDGSLAYLNKRKAMLNYAHFVKQGYPIGSGSAESGHKVVMQSRMKQAGMRWAEEHVDPMLSLRNLICNDRWQEGWQKIVTYRQRQRRAQLQEKCRATIRSAIPLPAKTKDSPSTSLRSIVPKPDKPVPKKPYKPAANHPWRKPFLQQSGHRTIS